MNGEFPWIYVAMLVIAFISWVFNRIQEATAERQRAAELKRRRQEQANQPTAQRQGSPPPLPSRGSSSPQEEPAEEPGELLKDLMEALGGPPRPEPTRQAERPPTSSPARAQRQTRPQVQEREKPKVKAPMLSAAERAAFERIEGKNAVAVALPKVKQRKASAAGADVRRLLGSSRGLRQAVILKEVLDAPLSMRDEGSFRA
jgi:hypothetical protein